MVLRDYRLVLDPTKITSHLGNLFGGNEVLGKQRATVVPSLAARVRMDCTDHVMSVFQATS
jgi:hypothetical protein